jgi:hypothetical protein
VQSHQVDPCATVDDRIAVTGFDHIVAGPPP